jgi:Concanavalin A-like lectin/glucanases superfamily
MPSQLQILNPGLYSFGNDSYTKIMLHMEGANAGTTFIDTAKGVSAPHSWTANSATTSTTTTKFGSTSLSVGSTGWIDTPDSADYTLGSGDWTLDTWFSRQGGDGAIRVLGGQSDSAATGSSISIGFQLQAANTIRAFAYTGAAFTNVDGTTNFAGVTTWTHVAFVRTGNTLKLFVNGTQEGGDVAYTTTVNDSSNKFAVGRLGELTTLTWNGYIDEFRLSKGIARWTSNFTAPTAPYS